ncbi:MAG TPA: PhoPQ-activated protein PqaA family protein [Pirellulales bacterium]|nr:PhoPQ-activated protein PqaA family protein [Pirellulales bacterium]
MKYWLIAAVVSLVVGAASIDLRAAEAGALERYVAAPDDSFQWVERRRGTQAGVSWVELRLTSQRWHDVSWKHQLFILKPSRVRDPSRGLMVIGGGAWRDELEQPETDDKLPGQAAMMAGVVESVGAPVAVLLQVPFQPMFNGMVEDKIIAYTFAEYLKTGDDTWPLLLPMVKSAVRGMDAVQQFAAREWSMDIKHFTLTGASKRGWTTWLTSAVDERVTALAPMVIDTLNMSAQMPHQLATWGNFSDQIRDYTERGLQQFLLTGRGRALLSIIDPYFYRAEIDQPKLIILGTNDRYWTLDALNLYWNDLVGPKYVLYVPNQGHGIRDLPRLLGTTVAFHRHAAGELKLADLTWNYEKQPGKVRLAMQSDVEPTTVTLWKAEAPTRDFRDAEWRSTPVPGREAGYDASVSQPKSGFVAIFGEAVFATESAPYYLSTTVQILGPQP